MNTHTLITLAALAALSATTASADEPAVPPTATPTAAATVASFTDAECLAIVNYLHRIKGVALHAAADAIEEEENLTDADFARLAAAELTDDIPADLRDYAHAMSTLINNTQQKLAGVQKQLRELRKNGEEDNEELEKPLRRQYQTICKQHEEDTKALQKEYPRAIFLTRHLSSDAVSEVLCELSEESDKSQAFLAANPRLKPGKRATAIAWLRHVASEEQATVSAEEARDRIRKLDLVSRLGFSSAGMVEHRRMSRDNDIPHIFPHDSSSGYTWQLATPLTEDSPVTIQWLTLPSAELQELKDLGVLSNWYSLPTSPDATVATLRTVKAGKVTVEFIYTRPGEAEPLLRMKTVIEVRDDEDDD